VKFEFTSAYQRCLRKLPSAEKAELEKLYKEMMLGQYPPGRDLKPIKGIKKNKTKVWQARLNRDYRIRFNFNKGVAKLLLVGPHKIFN